MKELDLTQLSTVSGGRDDDGRHTQPVINDVIVVEASGGGGSFGRDFFVGAGAGAGTVAGSSVGGVWGGILGGAFGGAGAGYVYDNREAIGEYQPTDQFDQKIGINSDYQQR